MNAGPGSEPRYRLESRIATGGMGEVWRATDTVLGREVAVKILKHEYADDPTFRSRFSSEARHAASLHHPGVASVFDAGEFPDDDGSGHPRPYLVMELVPGQPLSALLRGGEPMPPDTAADLVAQAADAIAAAHAMGIVHRDVKPGNLLVTPQGQVKITDFGIARAADVAGITQTGQVLGTPAYLAPEQAEGREATAASDVYALGVVLYECLAGVRPFVRDTPVSTALAHLRDEPPPLPADVPEQLRAVVATALAKDPSERFDSMAAMAHALRGGPVAAGLAGAAGAAGAAALADQPDATRVFDGPPVVPTSATRAVTTGERRRPAWLPWVGAAVAVLLVVLAISLLGGEDAGAPAGDNPDQPAETTPPPEKSASQNPTATDQSSPSEEPTASEDPTASEEPTGIEVVAADYVGMDKDEATARLEALGLKVKDESVDNDGSLVEDTVTDVVPAGTLAEGDEVTIFVADAPPDPEDEPGKSEDKGPTKDKG